LTRHTPHCQSPPKLPRPPREGVFKYLRARDARIQKDSAVLARFPLSRLLTLGLLILAATALIAAACSDDDDDSASQAQSDQTVGSTADAAFPFTFTDSADVEVTLQAPARRIVSYSPGATEILFAIGAGDQVIAADEFSDFPAATKALERVAYSDPDPERALTLDPDFLIMTSRQVEQAPQFRRAGLNVALLLEPESLDGVIENIRLLGRVTGNVDQANALADDMRTRIDAVIATISGSDDAAPVVLYELTNDLYTAGPDTFIGGMLTLLGARNVAQGATSPFPQLTAEAVIDADPNVVLLTDAEFGESFETVAARPGWSGVSAVVDQRVFPLDPDLVNRPGPRIVDGFETMAALLYPDLFE